MSNGRPSVRVTIAEWWYDLDQRAKLVLTAVFVLIIIALCALAAFSVIRLIVPRQEPTPTPTMTPTKVPVTPTATPAPTLAPTATLAPTLAPTVQPSPTPPPTDAEGDVGTYDTGDPVEDIPAGVDIGVASIAPDMRVVLQPGDEIPAAFADWVAEGEVLLWIALNEPVPDPPEVYVEWLFVLDMDGNVETGRPAGSARINPDLGMEVALGAFYDAGSGQPGTYFLVWDREQQALVRQAGGLRFTLDDSRTLVGMALPLETLTQAVQDTSGVTVVPDGVKGRAAALARVGAGRVIDFYPDRPE
jgi:hypothetical protein